MRYADSKCTCEKHWHTKRYIFTGTCVVTGKTVSVSVPWEELYAYRHGDKPIQDAMPSLSADEREFLMTGISAEGWVKTFPEE